MRALARRRVLQGAMTAVIGVALLLAFAAAAPAQEPVYGVSPQDGAVPSRAEIEEMAAGGVTEIRLILHWPTVEEEPGQYRWRDVDAIVRETTNYGVTPFFFLYGMPKWAAEADGIRCNKKCYRYAPTSGKTRRAFANFAAEAVKRYGPGGDFWDVPGAGKRGVTAAAHRGILDVTGVAIPCEPIPLPGCTPEEEPPTTDPPGGSTPPPPPPDAPTEPPPPPPSPEPPPDQPPCGCTEPHPLRHWQLLNEMNSPKYYQPKYDIRNYARLVRAAGQAIHEVDPEADVILGGVWGPQSASKVVMPIGPFLEQLYSVRGIKAHFDSIAIHPYAADPGDAVAQLKAARKVVKKMRDAQVGTWVTEVGWATDGPEGHPYVKDLKGQAKMLRKTLGKFAQNKGFRLQGVIWYSWRDLPGGEHLCDWCGYAGLRNLDGSPKPAWDEFSKLAKN